MKLRTAFALAVAALTLGVPVAGATPDGSQPQLKSVEQSDALTRYLRNNKPTSQPTSQPDALERYLQNNAPQTGAATHPDSHGTRFTLAAASSPAPSAESRDLTSGIVGALFGAFAAVLAIVGASAIRGRRRLAGAS